MFGSERGVIELHDTQVGAFQDLASRRELGQHLRGEPAGRRDLAPVERVVAGLQRRERDLGVAQQQSVVNQIIGVTVVIAVVVVGLFFALITVERTARYGVLKAIGAGSGTLFAGVLVQALVVTAVAAVVGAAAVGFALSRRRSTGDRC